MCAIWDVPLCCGTYKSNSTSFATKPVKQIKYEELLKDMDR